MLKFNLIVALNFIRNMCYDLFSDINDTQQVREYMCDV